MPSIRSGHFLRSFVILRAGAASLAMLVWAIAAQGQTFSISGTVTEAGTSNPVTDAEVCARLPDNSFPACNTTDSNGDYILNGLPAGTEYKVIARSPTYAAALYDGLEWPTTWAAGTAVAIGPGDATGINFEMMPGHTIGGQVTDAQTGDPLPGATICMLERATGLFAGDCAVSDQNGNYQTRAIQPGSDYAARLSDFPGYASELYDNVPYPASLDNATPIDISTADATNIHFALGPPPESATVTGTITDGDGNPVPDATVAIGEPASTGVLVFATTDGNGVYTAEIPIPATAPGVLPAAEREIVIEAAGPLHAPARFGAATAPACFFNCGGSDGALVVSAGDVVTANLQLPSGGNLAGRVEVSGSGNPLAGASIVLVGADETTLSNDFAATTDGSGDYQTSLAVPAGDYFLLAETPNQNFVTKAWNDRSCQWRSCPLESTDTVTINAGSLTDGVNFALEPGAVLSGRILPAGGVLVFDGAGRFLNFSFGDPWRVDALAGGSYYVEIRAFSSLDPFLRQLHNGEPCPWRECSRNRGEPLNVAPGATLDDLEYTLVSGGWIDGTAVDAATGLAPPVVPAANSSAVGSLDIVDAEGKVWDGADLEFDGSTVTILQRYAVPPGDYFVRTYDTFQGVGVGYTVLSDFVGSIPGFADQVSGGMPCAGQSCDLGMAVPVTISTDTATNLTIELEPGSNVSGSVVDDVSGDPLIGTTVKLVDIGNNTLAAAITDDSGEFDFGGFPAGTYYLRTSVAGRPGTGMFQEPVAYFDRVFGDASDCSEALCDPANGTPIILDGTADAGPFELRVTPGPVIEGRIIDQSTGLPINGGQVDVFDDLGEFVGTYVVSPFDGFYRTTALPPGTYTLVPEVSPAFVLATSASSPRAPNVRGQTGGFSVNLGTTSVQADTLIVQNYIFADDFE